MPFMFPFSSCLLHADPSARPANDDVFMGGFMLLLLPVMALVQDHDQF